MSTTTKPSLSVTVRLAYWCEAMLVVACPVCGFQAGEPCAFAPGTMHQARLDAWLRPGVGRNGDEDG